MPVNLAALVLRGCRNISNFYLNSLAKIRGINDGTSDYAYVANQGSNNISQYCIAAHGSLAPMVTATVAAGTTPV